MRVLSLCSGIGGIDLACEWAGMEIVGQVEIDKFCQQILTKHWPNVKRMNDIYEVNGDEFGTIDLLVAGIPCQPYSFAGKRRGAEDDRTIWPQAFNIIKKARPLYVLIENVAGFISMALDDVLSDLESEGYETRTFVLPACAVNAPHKRERVFILAHAQEQPGDGIGYGRADKTNISKQQVYAQARGSCSYEDVAHAENWQQQKFKASDNGREKQREAQERFITGASCGSERRDTSEGIENPGRVTTPISQDVAHAANNQLTRGRTSWNRGAESSNGSKDVAHATGGRTIKRSVEPGICGMDDGIPEGLDGTLEYEYEYGFELDPWQYGEWEGVPRIAKGVKDRTARLKALGNAVVPQQVLPVLLAIAEYEKQLNEANNGRDAGRDKVA